ncbi:MAG: ankyrin repeat domain-containing protein [Candidatus Margulisbacteria bacterium]|nr:ankyrin repeat domain-containing protein [Candidatus Margulisiibacteriota bacterium]
MDMYKLISLNSDSCIWEELSHEPMTSRFPIPSVDWVIHQINRHKKNIPTLKENIDISQYLSRIKQLVKQPNPDGEKVTSLINEIFGLIEASECIHKENHKSFNHFRNDLLHKLKSIFCTSEDKKHIIRTLMMLLQYVESLKRAPKEKQGAALRIFPFPDKDDYHCLKGTVPFLVKAIHQLSDIVSASLDTAIEKFTQEMLTWVRQGNQKHIPAFILHTLGVQEPFDDYFKLPIPDLPLEIVWRLLTSQVIPKDIHQSLLVELKCLEGFCKRYDSALNEKHVIDLEKNIARCATLFGITNSLDYCYKKDGLYQTRQPIGDTLLRDVIAKLTMGKPVPQIKIPSLREFFDHFDQYKGKIATWLCSQNPLEIEAGVKVLWLLSNNFPGKSNCTFLTILLEVVRKRSGIKDNKLNFEAFEQFIKPLFSDIETSLEDKGNGRDKLRDVMNQATILFTKYKQNVPSVRQFINYLNNPDIIDSMNSVESYTLLFSMINEGYPAKEIQSLLRKKRGLIRDYSRTTKALPINITQLFQHPQWHILYKDLSQLLHIFINSRIHEHEINHILKSAQDHNIKINDTILHGIFTSAVINGYENIATKLLSESNFSEEQIYATLEMVTTFNIKIENAILNEILIFSFISGYETVTPHLFSLAQSPEAVSDIIQFILDINAADEDIIKKSMLSMYLEWAIRFHQTDLADFMLDIDYNPNYKNSDGASLLCLATREDNYLIVDLLLKAGANPNSQNQNDQKTPLHIAAKYNFSDVVDRLLEQKNVNVTIKDGNGKTPFDLAKENNNAGYQITESIKAFIQDKMEEDSQGTSQIRKRKSPNSLESAQSKKTKLSDR